jgi:hypothetical protein
MLLLASLSAWIIFTLPLGFIQPPATSCILKENNSFVLKTPAPPEHMYKREVNKRALSLLVDSDLQKSGASSTDPNAFLLRNIRSYHLQTTAGESPLDVRFASNYKESEHSSWVSPLFSSIVYRTQVRRHLKADWHHKNIFPVKPEALILSQ